MRTVAKAYHCAASPAGSVNPISARPGFIQILSPYAASETEKRANSVPSGSVARVSVRPPVRAGALTTTVALVRGQVTAPRAFVGLRKGRYHWSRIVEKTGPSPSSM